MISSSPQRAHATLPQTSRRNTSRSPARDTARRSKPPTKWPRHSRTSSMDAELAKCVESLGLEKYRRHIFLCADQTEPHCAPREETLRSRESLKARLKELKLAGPEPLVNRTHDNCMRLCAHGPINSVSQHATWYHS